MTPTSSTASSSPLRRAAGIVAAVALSATAFVGCTTTGPNASSSAATSRESINSQTDAALTRLYNSVPQSREMIRNARGVLVCPQVLSGAFGIGAEYGRCVLREANGATSYYKTTALSVGLQAGAQSRAMYYVFTTQDAINKFKASNGWTAGIDATVAMANVGVNAGIDTNTLQQPVVGFVMTNAGLEAGAALQGSKFTRVDM